jgi:outer membrane protein assembly factor BamD
MKCTNMNRLFYVTKYLLLFFLLISLFEGCAFNKPKPKEPGPEALLERGLRQMNEGVFAQAAKTLQAVKDRYPYSKAAIIASLKLADALYNRDEYDVAYDLYDEFERLHPKDKSTPYAVYQKGMCHFNRMKSFDRDQNHTMRAKVEFERFVKLYPKSEYYNNAKKNIRKCLISLAKYELYVGHFYFKNGKYKPALERFTYLIKNYPDMGQYHEALEYISKCKEKLAEKGETDIITN